MNTKKFKCTLISDIVLSELAATEGIQRTLDYIPGNVFLGIVAGKLYGNIDPQLAMDLFHNAKVRFGDAYPMITDDTIPAKPGKRAIKVPASWYVKKGDGINDQIYIHHKMPEKGLVIDDKLEPTTQLRDKFIVKEDNSQFSEIKTEKNFAIKSAYDSEKRRSMDQQMYGYQSLEAGMKLCFQVDFDDTIDDISMNEVIAILLDNHTVGRSKTAQYGQVIIDELNEEEIDKGFDELISLEPDKTFLYAESRLLFIDEDNGQPIIPVDGKYFKIVGAKIDLNLSQIRTFRYAPYNSKRKSRDADRFGIEKGSVICINRAITSEEIEDIKKGIGLYLNEGFGKVLINPEFLKTANEATQGDSYFNFVVATPPDSPVLELKEITPKDKLTLSYLNRALKADEDQQKIYTLVNDFVEKNKSLFEKSNEQFASQWGTIRTKAMQANSKQALLDTLFLKAKDKDEAKTIKEGFLVSGQSATKWKDAQKRNLKDFLNGLEDAIALKTMINLSAEMAKKCKKGGIQ